MSNVVELTNYFKDNGFGFVLFNEDSKGNICGACASLTDWKRFLETRGRLASVQNVFLEFPRTIADVSCGRHTQSVITVLPFDAMYADTLNLNALKKAGLYEMYKNEYELIMEEVEVSLKEFIEEVNEKLA